MLVAHTSWMDRGRLVDDQQEMMVMNGNSLLINDVSAEFHLDLSLGPPMGKPTPSSVMFKAIEPMRTRTARSPR